MISHTHIEILNALTNSPIYVRFNAEMLARSPTTPTAFRISILSITGHASIV